VQNNPEERSQPKPAEGEKPKSGEASNSLKLFSGYLKDATGIVEMFERELYEAAMQAKSRNTGKTISELVEDRGREARGEKISPNPKKQENPIEPSTSKLGKSLEGASTAIDGFANDLTKGAKRFPDAQSLLPQKFPEAQSLLPQRFPDAQSLLPQKFPEAQSLLPQRFPDAQSLLPQKFPEAQSLLPQKFTEAQTGAITSTQKLDKSLDGASNAIDQFTSKLTGGKPITTTAKAIPARFAGG